MLKRFFIALAFLLTIVAIIFYYKLGGSQPLEFQMTTHPEFYVTGKYFEGRYSDPKIEELFVSARSRAEKDADLSLTVVNYPSRDNKVVRQFIGTGSLEQSDRVPDHLEVRYFPSQKAISTTIGAHNFVMPKPEDVREEALGYAAERNSNIDTLTYEIYNSDRELRVVFPVTEN